MNAGALCHRRNRDAVEADTAVESSVDVRQTGVEAHVSCIIRRKSAVEKNIAGRGRKRSPLRGKLYRKEKNKEG